MARTPCNTTVLPRSGKHTLRAMATHLETARAGTNAQTRTSRSRTQSPALRHKQADNATLYPPASGRIDKPSVGIYNKSVFSSAAARRQTVANSSAMGAITWRRGRNEQRVREGQRVARVARHGEKPRNIAARIRNIIATHSLPPLRHAPLSPLPGGRGKISRHQW